MSKDEQVLVQIGRLKMKVQIQNLIILKNIKKLKNKIVFHKIYKDEIKQKC